MEDEKTWVTQEIRGKMNLRDRLYQVQMTSTNDSDRERFKKIEYEVVCMLKTLYNNYLDSLVCDIDDIYISANSSHPHNKKLFSYPKHCRQLVYLV